MMKNSLLFYKNFKTFLLFVLITSFSNAQNLLFNDDFQANTQFDNWSDVASNNSLIDTITISTIKNNYDFLNNNLSFNSVFIDNKDYENYNNNTFSRLPKSLQALPICETITNPSTAQKICGTDPKVVSVSTNFIANNAISYVYFTSAQNGTNMYNGGTLLSYVTPVSGIAVYDIPIIGSTGSFPVGIGTYYVYAIANPTPTDPSCRPFQEIIIEIDGQTRTSFITATPSKFCAGSSVPGTIRLSVVGGTGPYTFQYTINGVAQPRVTSLTGNNFVDVPIQTGITGDFTYKITKFSDSNCTTLVTNVETKVTISPLPIVSTAFLPKPIVLPSEPLPNNTYQICQSPTSTLTPVFNLTVLIRDLLAGNLSLTPPVDLSNFETTFHTNLADATSGNAAIALPDKYIPTGLIIDVVQTIFIRVRNKLTGCLNFSEKFDIKTTPTPIVNPVILNKLTTCDTDGNNNGLFAYPSDNTLLIAEILGTQSDTKFTLTFHESEDNANTGEGIIASLSGYIPTTKSLWIRIQNKLTNCYEIGELEQNVEKIPEPIIQTDNNINTVCIDYVTGLPLQDLELKAVNRTSVSNPVIEVSYQWYKKNAADVFVAISVGGNNQTYLIDTEEPTAPSRFYKVQITNKTLLGCEATSAEFEVLQSGPAFAKVGTNGYYVSNAFESNQKITVTVDGYGIYEYSLDDGEPQESPVFENVALGSHLIKVYDVKGNCKPVLEIQNIQTIGYRLFFTPNGDGFNDSWNIIGLENQPDSKIYIFNREGKLIKQIVPNGEGWDGTFNNNPMPATDYWFTVDYSEQELQKQFKSHFSLKR